MTCTNTPEKSLKKVQTSYAKRQKTPQNQARIPAMSTHLEVLRTLVGASRATDRAAEGRAQAWVAGKRKKQ